MLIRALLIALAALSSLEASVRAAEPVAPASRYAVVDGAKLYYEECGSGAAIDVVLLHDGLLHAVTWDEVLNAKEDSFPKDLQWDGSHKVPPEWGTLLAFRRAENSFHGHKPFVGGVRRPAAWKDAGLRAKLHLSQRE